MSEINELAAALVKAQAELKNPKLDSTNPHFRSKFASLACVRDTVIPTLAKHGIAVVQNLVTNEHGVGCETVLLHSSGQSMKFGPLFLPASKHDPQGFGSCATYARRYALMAALCVVGDEDDDANAGTETHKRNGKANDDAPALPTHVDAIRAYLEHGQAEQAAQLLATLSKDEKRAVWKQITAAERERLKVFFPRQQQTEVVQ